MKCAVGDEARPRLGNPDAAAWRSWSVDAKQVEEEVLAAERRWMDALVAKDAAGCERLLAPEYSLTTIGLGPAGRMPRARWLEVLPDYDIHETRIEEGRVLAYDDAAVFQGRIFQRASAMGSDRSGVFLTTDVWVRRDGRWQVVARHTSLEPRATG